jgi:hypothetical protein
MYTISRTRVLSSALLERIGTKPVVACGKETYKLNLKDHDYNRLLSGCVMSFTISSFNEKNYINLFITYYT